MLTERLTNILPEAKAAIISQFPLLRVDMLVTDAIPQMNQEQNLTGGCVVDQAGRVVGVLTCQDMISALNQHHSLDNLSVGEVMQETGLSIQESSFNDILTVSALMAEYGVDCLPIVNQDQHPIGLVTAQGILQLLSTLSPSNPIPSLVLEDKFLQPFEEVILTQNFHHNHYPISLREHRSCCYALMEGAGDAIILTDSKGNILEVNRQAQELFGYTRKQFYQLHTFELFNPENLVEFSQAYVEVVQGQRTQILDTEIISQAGRKISVDVSATVIQIGRDQVIQSIFRDITERKWTEDQLRQTNLKLIEATKLKDEFLANMSHELRTPLNTILGMTEGLQEGVFGQLEPRQSQAIRMVERSGAHLLALINDVLDLAKIEAGKVELELVSTTIDSLCRTSLEFIKYQADKKQISLDLQLPPQLPPVNVDPRRIHQVLINFLSNAVKFTPAQGKITLKVTLVPLANQQSGSPDTPNQNFVEIAVIDTGIGLAPDQLEKLFQPFVQIDSALNRQYEGTGLGLAMAKRIVQLHEGTVGVTSQLGQGSCFKFCLPCDPIDRFITKSVIETCQALPITPAPPNRNPLILLVEDNDANIRTMTSYLQAKSYQVLVAKNGHECLILAEQYHPDLILMDIQMPGMDGLEAIQNIRLTQSEPPIPIVALTALAMLGDADRCLAAGANVYCSKPVKLKELEMTIHKLLALH